jgi:O-antigen/teichoic acid export membrane protein
MIGLMVFGGRLVSIMYGLVFSDGGYVVGILAANFVATAVAMVYSKALLALRRPKSDALVNLAAVAIMLIAGRHAVETFSVVGAAAVMLASTIISGVVRIVAFERLAARALRVDGSPQLCS